MKAIYVVVSDKVTTVNVKTKITYTYIHVGKVRTIVIRSRHYCYQGKVNYLLRNYSIILLYATCCTACAIIFRFKYIPTTKKFNELQF